MQMASSDRRATIMTVGGEKGGTGKTTMAINLAVCRARAGGDVILIDTDTQGSASDWIEQRNQRGHKPTIASAQQFGTKLGATLEDLAKRYTDIIIDAGGRDSPEMRAAMTMTHKMLVPVQASTFDLWTLERIDTLAGFVEPFNPDLKVLVMLSRGATNPSVKDAEKARSFISEYERFTAITVEVHDRVAYQRTARDGAGVVEADDEKAKAEIIGVYEQVYGVKYVEVSNVDQA